MATEGTTDSAEARELNLVSKVELRIALADSDDKLQKLLQTYLAPLLLKLASDSLAVRNKVLSVCQHINTRIKPQSIQLPVAALLKQFKEQTSQLVRHFDLVYIQQGLDRLEASARVELLPAAFEGISRLDTTSTQSAIGFNLILRLLPLLHLPPKDSREDSSLRDKLLLSDEDVRFLSVWFGKFFLLSSAGNGASTCPGLSPLEYSFLNKSASFEETWDPKSQGGLNLTETKLSVAKFLTSGVFTDPTRFLPAVILSADSNSRLSDIGDDILKRFNPNLEDTETVEELYKLYFGTTGANAAPPVRIPLQVKLLVLLGRSVKATSYTEEIIKLLDDGLFSDTAKSGQGLQTSKLRSQIFTFTTWIVRMGAPINLKVIAPKTVVGLRGYVESQGWPDPSVSGQKLSPADISSRGLAYESIGILTPKIISTNDTDYVDMDLLRWLFTSLASDNSASEISVSVEQALGTILNSLTGNFSEKTRLELGDFLVKQMKLYPGKENLLNGFSIVRSTHYTAVKYANRCLPFWDLTARWVDLLAIGSKVGRGREIIEEGKKGLHPYWYRMLNPVRGVSPVSTLEKYQEDSRYNFPSFQLATKLLSLLNDPDSSPQSIDGVIAPAIRFCKNLLIFEAFSKANISIEIDQEWEYRLDTLLQSDPQAREAVKVHINQQPTSNVATLLGTAVEGILGNGAEAIECSKDFIDISSLTSNGVIASSINRAKSLPKLVYDTNNYTLQNAAARVLGILASHPSLATTDCQQMSFEALNLSTAWKGAVGQAANRVRGAVLTESYILSRLSFRQRLDTIPETQVQEYIGIIVAILTESRDSQLLDAVHVAISQLALSHILNFEVMSEAGILESIKAKLAEAAKNEKESAIHALGHLALVMPKEGEHTQTFNTIMESFHDLHEIRKPEVQFAVGDSICVAAAGWESKSLIGELDVDGHPFKINVPGEILAKLADDLITNCRASKPSLRKASAIWLLCLVKNCGQLDEVRERLRNTQAAFTSLLADRDDLVQETGSRGLSLVYEMGDQELRDDLVRDLISSFTGNNPTLAGNVSSDTKLFEPGALPTGEGKSVTTYKDIMNLASEVGDPSLVYRFMSMASNNAIWSSRAAFGRFGLSAVLSDSSMDGYLSRNPKIYPKLYRYRFDPNPNVQRSMNDIWQTIVKEPNVLLETHFDAIMDDLLSSIIAGREWRVREASCSAIADLIQGRPLDKYEKYMNEILIKAFKVMDDIKESVRAAALRLCQVITNILTRTLETGDTESRRAKTMLGHLVPFLLGQRGMESSAQEVQAYSITTVIQIIKKSPSALLRPFIPQILERFLSSLSSLEPQAVNYIHLNADKYGLTGNEVDNMRLSSIRMSPMMESIERYLLDGLDEESMKEVAARLEVVLRTAVGLPSKVGCSRVLALLSTKNIIFRPYADKFIQILKKYVLDRNETVSVSYSASIGYMIRLASDEKVLDMIEFAKGIYFNAEEQSHQTISAEILQSMSKLSSDRFSNFTSAALPFVFVAKHNTDEQTREIFEKTWQDNVGGSRAVSLYLNEIREIISERLESTSWAIKHSSSLAVADIVTSLGTALDHSAVELIWPLLERALSGKTWDGKETVLKAFVKFTENSRAIWELKPEIGQQMKVIMLREAKRNNAAYRSHALSALAAFAEARQDLYLLPEAISIVEPVVEDLTDSDGTKMEIDSDHSKTTRDDEILAACTDCLLRCVNPTFKELTPGKFGKFPSYKVSAYPQEENLTAVSTIIESCLRGNSRRVLDTFYTGLRATVTKFGKQIPLTKEASDLEKLKQGLQILVDKLLFQDWNPSVESLRTKRAQAVNEFITVARQAEIRVDDQQRRWIDEWLAQERSEPIQHIFKTALQKL
ncbi:putative proteasome component [Talaromyces proteolyticus]|uniref:Proteasome component n=1 Tax=Talaromyces proteolyticus TaxID=1131652 RepID=A0AAD4PTI5_9EURO|nr:putative proteasome component [Talaromyces proteolyticus]KAH8693533.1 putative proteasome component [Talaromyces proteolyticus]